MCDDIITVERDGRKFTDLPFSAENVANDFTFMIGSGNSKRALKKDRDASRAQRLAKNERKQIKKKFGGQFYDIDEILKEDSDNEK